MTIQECIQAWLSVKGKSQKAIADQAGIPEPKFSDLANGVNPNPEWNTIQKLARGFDVGVVEFFSGPRSEQEVDDGAEGRETRTGAAVGRGAGLASILIASAAQLDLEMPHVGDNSWRGDVQKAIAALARALGRETPTSDAGDASAKTRR